MSQPPGTPPVPTGRVVLVANNFPPVRGGSAVVYANIARCAGDRMTVIAPRVDYNDGLPMIGWREFDRRASHRVIRLDLLRTRLRPPGTGLPSRLAFLAGDVALRVRLGWALLWQVARHDVRTLCVGELSASSWVIHVFAGIAGLRTIAYVHGEEITTEDPYDPDHARARRTLLACDSIVVVSRFTRDAVARLLGDAAGRRVVLIENGVDTARFVPAAKDQGLLDAFGLGGRFVFVSVCRLLEKKGVDNTLRAFAQLSDHLPEARYLVVGGGPFAGRLQALAAELGVAGRVVFAGQVADHELVDHYRLGDVFVMPNRELPNGDTEGFGLVFLEANGCGLPVIAGQDGGSTDAVQDGVNGLVVDGRSVDAIAGAMLRLHEDAALRELLRQGGFSAAAAAGWVEKTAVFLGLCAVA